MKDLFVIPECYIDTNLVEMMLSSEGCNHQKGCNTVVGTMQTKFAEDFAIGVIDDDKRQVKYVNDFQVIAQSDSLKLLKHKDKHHYLIMVHPAMDGFIMKCVAELGGKMSDYGFSDELKKFTQETKQVTSKADPKFRTMFQEIAKAKEMKLLKVWLKYLKEKKYNSKPQELQDLVKQCC